MKKAWLYMALMGLSTSMAFAQQDAEFTQYMQNLLYYTPAYAGVDGVTKASVLYRSQWLGYQSSFDDGGAPTSQIFSMNTPIYKIHSGAGFYLLNDKLGPQNNFQAQGSFAHHFAVRDAKLSIGVRLGLYAQTLNYDVYRAIQPDDPLLVDKSGKESQVRPDLAAGVFYRKQKYYVGIGVDHLLKSQFDFGTSQSNALQPHLSVVAGYYADINFDLQIQPTILIRSDFNEYSVEAGAIAVLRNTMWGGLSFRQSEAAILLLGYNMLKDKSLKLGYALDYIVKDRQAKEATSHEIMLSYELPVPATGRKIIRTPRYRH